MTESKLIPIIDDEKRKEEDIANKLGGIRITDSEMKKLIEKTGKYPYQIISEIAGKMGANEIYWRGHEKNGHGDELEYYAIACWNPEREKQNR